MCGICGYVTRGREVPPDPVLLGRMIAPLTHRGPDGKGSYLGEEGVALGMRRLSIVDLETGDQPIPNEDGSVMVVCNGEIYNAPELQRELGARGHRFRGHSDVEVIPHLYEELGPELLGRLRPTRTP
jgi:asparagine synthase (glutamine-hydrolysing)